ncbi:ThiF family adenylyltransferase [Desulfobulbus rhabdoformis]|jgi:hypothetical protein|uniref:ThiF family adenylyltransferase n=1 Tax=Desulfobulbus rhabdoformis TaxID=34032 RepID=UPI0019652235|nr:ThiF family adenylyltransferase [Desulfobulbus rhabdoformis]MBM9616030.1 ThiF family adenylyltransferase [Desulfobulbus rhabdoformis]
MSPRPIVLDPDLERLQKEGYAVEVSHGHVLVHSVPYVTSQREVKRGIVVTNLNGNVGQLGSPADHQVWFVGEYPCHHTGKPIESIRHSSQHFPLWTGFIAQHRFSNKPPNGYPDFYSKMKSYISIISNEAKVIDPAADPRTHEVIVSTEVDSVFRYWDSASTRANILAVSEKLAMNRIAIIGLGGTGSYLLDLVAKTPAREIHLYDGDKFLQHNAFRAPGAASIEELEQGLPKVDYYSKKYDKMRTGIYPHDVYLDEDNISELQDFDFVFVCVDKGPVRKLLSRFLQRQEIPFIDVGMELHVLPENNCIYGTCRVTLSTPQQKDHFAKRATMSSGSEGGIYDSNIQVADMNALNAALAVAKWKQFCTFYQDLRQVHHTTYSINSHSLTKDEMPELTEIK